MKIWKTIFYTLAFFPVIYLISLYTFYFHFAIKLGYFPSYNHPDPKTSNLYEIYQPIITTFGNIWLILLYILIPLIPIYWIIYRKKINWKPVIVSCICFLITFLSIFTGVTEWFAD